MVISIFLTHGSTFVVTNVRRDCENNFEFESAIVRPSYMLGP